MATTKSYVGFLAVLSMSLLGACSGGGSMHVDSSTIRGAGPDPGWRLEETGPFESREGILAVSVFAKEGRIEDFYVDSLEARDQEGRLCGCDGCGASMVKGGVRMWVRVKPDRELTRQVSIKAKLGLNGRIADIEVAARRRTQAERMAINPDLDWTFLDEPRVLRFRK